MKKFMMILMMVVCVAAIVLCVIAGHNKVKNYIHQKNTDIKYWSKQALGYQSEAMSLTSELEVRANKTVELQKIVEEKYQELKYSIEYYTDILRHHEVSHFNTVDSEPNFTDIVAQAIKSVVHIRCPKWQGSGFVIDKNIICTARHVVEDVENFEITFNDGKKLHVNKAISDKKHDVGFIWVEEDMNDVAKINSSKDCKLGQDVFIIGSPFGDINFNSVSKGIISGLNRDWDEINPWTGEHYGWEVSFTSDSAAHPGNSGGPVFTMDGVVRGILVGGYSPVLNCSMPCDLFLLDIEQIRLMFIMDRYEFEKEEISIQSTPYYNYQEDNEYYKEN